MIQQNHTASPAPDGGKASAAVVDVSRGTIRLQLSVWGQPL
ncbi:hypothetical protein ACFRJ9_22515 [Paenarthrobacter sp. NPDC056912]